GPDKELRPSIAFDLRPLAEAFGAFDVIELRQISLSEASAALMRNRLPWLPPTRAARNTCRRLLRDEDAILGWRRIVWCSVASLVARPRDWSPIARPRVDAPRSSWTSTAGHRP